MCIASTVLAMSSCSSVEKALPLSSINGEWNIIEINGAKVNPDASRTYPFIAFDTNAGRVYGSSGCNRMMASLKLDTKPGTVDFGALGTTKMACPDMVTERNVLNALEQVKHYKKAGKEKIFLCNSSNRPVILLEKKRSDREILVLEGDWSIAEVNGEAVPDGLENQPFLSFNLQEKRIHGNAGCNTLNGDFQTDSKNSRSISFPGTATTMMACPNMELEGKILKALNEVSSFDTLSEGIGLYDASSKLVLVLKKK